MPEAKLPLVVASTVSPPIIGAWLEPASAVVAGDSVLVTAGELPSVAASRECPEREGVTPQEVPGRECVNGKFPAAAYRICVQVECSG